MTRNTHKKSETTISFLKNKKKLFNIYENENTLTKRNEVKKQQTMNCHFLSIDRLY